MDVKRALILVLLFLLTACVTAQEADRSAALIAPACNDGAEAWRGYLAAIANPGTADPDPLLDCAVARGQVDAMTAQGASLTSTSRDATRFERGIGLLRTAAIAGEERAQRILAYRYQAGKDWVGRNAYLALFWTDVANRDDPDDLSAPKTDGMLEIFRDHLSARSRRILAERVAAWRPGIAEPPNYTFDIMMTAVLQDGSTIAPPGRGLATEPIIDYGLRSEFPDAPLLGLMFGYNDRRDGIPEALLAEMSQKGSLLSLMLALRQIGAQDGREAEENALILQLLARLGLDVRHLRPRHDAVLQAFSKTGDLDALMREVAGASRPERPILATIASMIACNGDRTESCAETADRLGPLITQPAMNFIVLVNAMDRCDARPKRYACLFKNGGMAALRDIIVSDLVDFGGRAT